MRVLDVMEVWVDYTWWKYDKWFPSFAWYPVKIRDHWVWLEPVEKCTREGCLSDYRYPGDTTPTCYERLKHEKPEDLKEAVRLRCKEEYKYEYEPCTGEIE